MFFPQFQTGFCPAQDMFFASWIITILTPVPGPFQCPQSFRFMTLTRCFSSSRLAHFSVVTLQLFPFFSFNSFVNCLAESVPVHMDQRQSPPLKLNMLCVDESALHTHLISSQYQLICSFSDGRLWKCQTELRFCAGITLVPRRRSPASTAPCLSASTKVPSLSMMPLLLLSCKPVMML